MLLDDFELVQIVQLLPKAASGNVHKLFFETAFCYLNKFYRDFVGTEKKKKERKKKKSISDEESSFAIFFFPSFINFFVYMPKFF